MTSRHFHQCSEFVYAFLNPHFIRLSLLVQEAVVGYHHSFPPPHPHSIQIVPSPLKMINSLLGFAVYLLVICFL